MFTSHLPGRERLKRITNCRVLLTMKRHATALALRSTLREATNNRHPKHFDPRPGRAHEKQGTLTHLHPHPHTHKSAVHVPQLSRLLGCSPTSVLALRINTPCKTVRCEQQVILQLILQAASLLHDPIASSRHHVGSRTTICHRCSYDHACAGRP